MVDKSKITQRLLNDKKMFEEQNRIVLGIFLTGSQNYGVDYEGSYIDTKAILIPHFRDFCLNNPIISTTYKYDNGEQIDIKDIRSMFKYWLKQNINFLEVLFTKYNIIDPNYWNYFKKIHNRREEIAHYDMYRAIQAMYGDMLSKKSRLEKITPATQEVINKYGFNPKELHHIIRLEEFIKRYLLLEPYQDCLVSKQPDYLIDIKRNPQNYIDSYKGLAEKSCREIGDLLTSYTPSSFELNLEIPVLLETIMLNIFEDTFRRELQII